MDTLAQSYARELNPWGIETTIVLPGIITKGTGHFAHAMQPGLPDVAKEYDEGPTKGVSEQNMKGTADSVPQERNRVWWQMRLYKWPRLQGEPSRTESLPIRPMLEAKRVRRSSIDLALNSTDDLGSRSCSSLRFERKERGISEMRDLHDCRSATLTCTSVRVKQKLPKL